MSGKRCPRCNLINPAVAMRCDCGYAKANNFMLAGGGLLFLAAIYTGVSIYQAQAVETSVRYYPAMIIIGAVLFLIGLTMRLRS
jgi:hypothetical protein